MTTVINRTDFNGTITVSKKHTTRFSIPRKYKGRYEIVTYYDGLKLTLIEKGGITAAPFNDSNKSAYMEMGKSRTEALGIDASKHLPLIHVKMYRNNDNGDIYMPSVKRIITKCLARLPEEIEDETHIAPYFEAPHSARPFDRAWVKDMIAELNGFRIHGLKFRIEDGKLKASIQVSEEI